MWMSVAGGTVPPVNPTNSPVDHVSDALSADLTAVDHATLQIEHQRWKYAGAKEQHIRSVFDESPTRYYQLLNALLDTAAAEAAYPMLVRRLRRLRDQRRQARVAAGRGQASLS